IATDGGSLVDTKTVTISVTDVNETPSITSGTTGSVTENNAAGAAIYTATTSDPDTTPPNKTMTWTPGGTDASDFSFDASGVVTINAAANYESKSIHGALPIVIASGGGSLVDTKTVTISVTDVNETPSITSGATGSVTENNVA